MLPAQLRGNEPGIRSAQAATTAVVCLSNASSSWALFHSGFSLVQAFVPQCSTAGSRGRRGIFLVSRSNWDLARSTRAAAFAAPIRGGPVPPGRWGGDSVAGRVFFGLVEVLLVLAN